MSRLSHRQRAERGGVAVEFALVLPILMLIVLGIIEFGLALNTQIGLTQAAREGVRVAAVDWEATAGDMEDAMSVAFSGVTATSTAPTVVGADTCPENPSNTDRARLEISLDYTPPIVRFGPFSLTAEAVMRCGG